MALQPLTDGREVIEDYRALPLSLARLCAALECSPGELIDDDLDPADLQHGDDLAE